jgi:reverse gyrase
LAAIFVEAQRREDVITAPTVTLATQVREKLEMQEKSLGMQGLSSPAITTTTRNRQK